MRASLGTRHVTPAQTWSRKATRRPTSGTSTWKVPGIGAAFLLDRVAAGRFPPCPGILVGMKGSLHPAWRLMGCALVLEAGRSFRSFPISPLSSLQSCSRRKSANPESWPNAHTLPAFQSHESQVWLYIKTFEELWKYINTAWKQDGGNRAIILNPSESPHTPLAKKKTGRNS